MLAQPVNVPGNSRFLRLLVAFLLPPDGALRFLFLTCFFVDEIQFHCVTALLRRASLLVEPPEDVHAYQILNERDDLHLLHTRHLGEILDFVFNVWNQQVVFLRALVAPGAPRPEPAVVPVLAPSRIRRFLQLCGYPRDTGESGY